MRSFVETIAIDNTLGMPSDQVHAIDQDASGRLWLAGPAGLSRYDGSRIHVFDNRTGLTCQGLRTITISDDVVWIGNDRGIETILTNGEPTGLGIDSWDFGLVERIAIDDSTVWAGSTHGLVKFQWEKNAFNLTPSMIAEVRFVRDIALRADKTVLAATAQGLILSDGVGWCRVVNTDIPDDAIVYCLYQTAPNNTLVGTDNGLVLLDEHERTIDRVSLPEKSQKISAIAIAGDQWWVGAGRTLYLFEERPSGAELVDSYPINSFINNIFIDRVQNVWLALNTGGIQKLSCLRSAITRINPGSDGAVYSIKKIDDAGFRIGGELFCSTIPEAERFDSTQVSLISELQATTVWDSCENPVNSSEIFFATQDGLFTVDNGRSKPFESNDPILKSPARSLITRGDDLYVGTLGGLCRISGDETVEVKTADGTNLGYVYSLTIDDSARMWVATLGRGLWRETKDGLVSVADGPLSAVGNTYAAVPNKNGMVLVIQDERVVIVNPNGKSRLVLSEYPMAGWCGAWIDDQTVVVGSNDGLIVIDIVANAIVKRVNPLLGPAGWQFTNNRSLFVQSAERIYCGLNTGLVRVNLSELNSHSTPPEVYVDQIIWVNVEPDCEDGMITLSPGKWSFTASVYSGWLVAEEQVRYRFKLVGFDADWSEIQRVAEIKFNSLPPGEYTLICQAYTPLTGFGKSATLLKLDVSAPWWSLGLANMFDSVDWVKDRFVDARFPNDELIGRNRELETEVRERREADKQLNNYRRHLENLIKIRTGQLSVEKERAESADRLKSAFLATMSHELRTPLNSIIGFTGILMQELAGPVNSEQQKQLEMVQSSSRHLLALINDVLDISKIEAGELGIDYEQFDLRASIEKVSEAIRPLAEKKNLTLSIEIAPEIQTIDADIRRVEQVLLNLLGNAVKFTVDGGVTLAAVVSNDLIIFCVEDTGIGIRAEDMPLLFKPFQQIESGLARNHEGTGLGLTICRRLAKIMGGEIRAESVVGKGSKFTFTIPAARRENV